MASSYNLHISDWLYGRKQALMCVPRLCIHYHSEVAPHSQAPGRKGFRWHLGHTAQTLEGQLCRKHRLHIRGTRDTATDLKPVMLLVWFPELGVRCQEAKRATHARPNRQLAPTETPLPSDCSRQ